MNHFTGYGAYRLFLALRTHFTNRNYDFFVMNGKTRASKDSYMKRNDRLFFDRLANKYDPESLRDFYVSNFLDDKRYVTELLDDDAENNFLKYQARRQSLTYNVSNDLDKILGSNHKKMFSVQETHYPEVIVLLLRKRVCIETIVILNDFINFISKYDKYYDDDVIWPKVSLKVRKYKPFLKYDGQKMRSILKEKINERSNSI